MADIFREIDEELRQDRAARLWKQYGWLVIAAAVLVVAAVGGWRYWQYYDRTVRAEESAAYDEGRGLVAAGETDAALDALGTLAVEGSTGYAVLARLQQAALAARAGDVEGALIAWTEVIEDEDAPLVLRDLARLGSVSARLETAAPDELHRDLDRLAAVGSTWRPMALELKALLWLSSGETALAREAFETLSDDARTPQRMRARVTELLHALPAS